MSTIITAGIRISVNHKYKELYSNPYNNQYLFSYRISITNENESPVRLICRHWYIFDSSGEFREVEGEGVIGLQPVLEPGKSFVYESACNLTTDIGKMYGSYLMERLVDGHRFRVAVPEFIMFLPWRLN